jgi:hypothetical protein
MRWVIVIGASLILVVAAFVGGWVLGKNAPTAVGGIIGTPVAPAPADGTAWKYPGGEEMTRMTSEKSASGTARAGPVHVTRLVTPDPFEQVLAHYATVLGQHGIGAQALGQGVAGARVASGGQEVFSCSHLATSRPGVKGRVIAYQTSTYALVIDVTRADADTHTHIVIAYTPHP